MTTPQFTIDQLLQWLGYLSKGQFETINTRLVDTSTQSVVYRKADLMTISDLVYRTTHQGESLTVCYFNQKLYLYKGPVLVEFTQGGVEDVH